MTALPDVAAGAAEKPGLKRGVSIYSYSDDIFKTATLEDCLAAVGDLAGDGEVIGLEILANSHIEGYPNPSDAWVAKWLEMCASTTSGRWNTAIGSIPSSAAKRRRG